MNCPICEQLITDHYVQHTEEGILMEEEADCKDAHHFYHYHYHHGHTEEQIGVASFHHYYGDGREVVKHKQFIRKATVYYERLWYEKSKGKQG